MATRSSGLRRPPRRPRFRGRRERSAGARDHARSRMRRLLDGGRYADAERDARAALASMETVGDRGIGRRSRNARRVGGRVVARRQGSGRRRRSVCRARHRDQGEPARRRRPCPRHEPRQRRRAVLRARRLRARGAAVRARARDPVRARPQASLATRPSSAGCTRTSGRCFRSSANTRLRASTTSASLETLRDTLGAEHTQVAMTANNLATLLARSGDHDEALRLYRESLAVLERALGPEHPLIANSKHNLAELDQRLGPQRRGDRAVSRSHRS